MGTKYKHTPAPWRPSGTYGMVVTDKLSICQLEVNHNESTFNFEQYKANAKLIAAAPDLLEALIRLIDRIEENGLQDRFPRAYVIACEAVDKATS